MQAQGACPACHSLEAPPLYCPLLLLPTPTAAEAPLPLLLLPTPTAAEAPLPLLPSVPPTAAASQHKRTLLECSLIHVLPHGRHHALRGGACEVGNDVLPAATTAVCGSRSSMRAPHEHAQHPMWQQECRSEQ